MQAKNDGLDIEHFFLIQCMNNIYCISTKLNAQFRHVIGTTAYKKSIGARSCALEDNNENKNNQI